MKQNKFTYLKRVALLFTFAISVASCDYLDVIPDDLPTIDHAFRDRASAEKSLFTCFSYMPSPNQPWMDPALLGSDEFYTYDTEGKMTRSHIGLITGKQTTDSPIYNCWDGGKEGKPLYQGIRDCNTFLEKIREPYDITMEEVQRWSAEAQFLKAYYHFYLLRMYGAIPIVDKNMSVSAPIEDMNILRNSFDECVEYIDSLLLKAERQLPIKIDRPTTEMGRITKAVALSVRAQLWMTAASPLFNGNPDYANIIDKKGKHLFPTSVDNKKWETAVEACKTAIDAAKAAGHDDLYRMNVDPMPLNEEMRQQLGLRMIMYDRWNKEIVWGLTNFDSYWTARLTMPKLTSDHLDNWELRGLLNPTLDVVETYYTKNGVPIDEDIDFDYPGRYERRTATEREKWYIKVGQETAKLHFDREPRFYASIGFDRGIWFGNGSTNVSDYNSLYYLQCRSGELAGQKKMFYSITGYYSKKLCDYRSEADKTTMTQEKNLPFPEIRLADLYLYYAEALNEVNEIPTSEVYEYIDYVRARAGLDGVVQSWAKYSNNPAKPLGQKGMREIIQQERMIELAMEGKRYWDIRRWKLGSKYFTRPIRSWNVKGKSAEDYYNLVLNEKRSYTKKDYLWPIDESKITNNPNLKQNYGWE